MAFCSIESMKNNRTHISIAVSRQLVSQSFDEIVRLDSALAEILSRIRQSRESVAASRALLRCWHASAVHHSLAKIQTEAAVLGGTWPIVTKRGYTAPGQPISGDRAS